VFETLKVSGEQKSYRVKLTFILIPLAMPARTMPEMIAFGD